MRLPRATRSLVPPPRLAFEPLESRDLLAADVGLDRWTAENVSADDWSWNFGDAHVTTADVMKDTLVFDDGAAGDADASIAVLTDLPAAFDIANEVGETGGVGWEIDMLPQEGLPPEPSADGGVADDLGTDVEIMIADDPASQTTMVVTSVAGSTAAVPPVAVRSTAAASAGRPFAAWGGFFLPSFGGQAAGADGTATGGPAVGQPGSGRPRLRLPFRPVV